MRYLIVVLLLFLCAPLQAEFTWAEVEVEGLTCSMCARSVEIKVRDLAFVEDLKMDLVATTMRISFKKGSHVDVRSLADAVDDSGFSVGYVKAAFRFEGVEVRDGKCLLFEDVEYNFVKTGNRVLDGETILQFLGEPFLPERELDQWKGELISECDSSGKPVCFVTVL